MPSCCVFHDFEIERIQALIDQKEALIQQNNKRNVFVILDDVGFDQKSLNSRIMHCLLMNGRRYRITLIAAVQECYAYRPEMRSQLDVIVCLKTKPSGTRKKCTIHFSECSNFYNLPRRSMRSRMITEHSLSIRRCNRIQFRTRYSTTRHLWRWLGFCMVNATSSERK